MSGAAAKRLAWALALLSLGLYLAGVTLELAAGSEDVASQAAFLLVNVVGFSTVGVLIASSPVRNRIAWIYCGVACSAGLAAAAGGYADFWLDGRSGARALGEMAALYSVSAWMGWVLVPATFLLLLFPDGNLLSRRWRIVAWCAGIGIAGEFAVGALRAGPLDDYPQVINPIGVHLPDFIEGITSLLTAIAILGSAASLVSRFRRVSGPQRQQIKWLVYAGAVAAPTILIVIAAYDVVGAATANAVIQIAILAVPLAAGVAILRYRLYDIDVVVNRTLVYGGLTATLAGTYVGSVLLLQLAFGREVSQQSDLIVAGSTLAVAALFRPLRARIQRVVDRRFYRNRYDAARTVAAFSGRLRDEVDLLALSTDLRDVVRETVQPSHVSLWMPSTESRR